LFSKIVESNAARFPKVNPVGTALPVRGHVIIAVIMLYFFGAVTSQYSMPSMTTRLRSEVETLGLNIMPMSLLELGKTRLLGYYCCRD
jgi:anaerobic C4-dicarboxylate transporter